MIEPEMAQTVPRTRNKGKKKAAVVVDSEESFVSEDSNTMSDSSYSPSDEDTTLYLTPNVANSRKIASLQHVSFHHFTCHEVIVFVSRWWWCLSLHPLQESSDQ